MKELSKVTKYNRLKTCKKQTRLANATEANEGCVSWGGGQRGSFKKRGIAEPISKKGNAWCQIRSANGGCFPHSEEKSKDDMHTEMKSRR